MQIYSPPLFQISTTRSLRGPNFLFSSKILSSYPPHSFLFLWSSSFLGAKLSQRKQFVQIVINFPIFKQQIPSSSFPFFLSNPLQLSSSGFSLVFHSFWRADHWVIREKMDCPKSSSFLWNIWTHFCSSNIIKLLWSNQSYICKISVWIPLSNVF